MVVNKSTSSVEGGMMTLTFTAEFDAREETGIVDIVFNGNRSFTITAGDIVKTISY